MELQFLTLSILRFRFHRKEFRTLFRKRILFTIMRRNVTAFAALRRGRRKFLSFLIDLFPLSVYIFHGRGEEGESQGERGRAEGSNERRKLTVSIHVAAATRGEYICVWTTGSSSMSHGFCHISIDVESSMYSTRRYTFRTVGGFRSLYFRWRDAFHRGLVLELTSFASRKKRARNGEVSVLIDGTDRAFVVEEEEKKNANLKVTNHTFSYPISLFFAMVILIPSI